MGIVVKICMEVLVCNKYLLKKTFPPAQVLQVDNNVIKEYQTEGYIFFIRLFLHQQNPRQKNGPNIFTNANHPTFLQEETGV